VAAEGGPDAPENLVTLCAACHAPLDGRRPAARSRRGA
jgi:hypothetical protein